MSKDFWNERYASPEYAYGTEPSEFLLEQLPFLKPGTILFPGEGEGRNAVYAAHTGWTVTAFDHSEEGRRKALSLAAARKVIIDYHIASFDAMPFREGQFDAIALIFIHPPAGMRHPFLRDLISYLKPGGTILLEGFSKEQVHCNSGGPKDESMLFSVEEIQREFAGLDIMHLSQKVVHLREGAYHSGEAHVIDCIAVKK